MKSPIWTSIDFDAIGYQADFARLPYSSDTSAYGWIPIPMVCLKGGDGPTALLTAGTHGDEYEGQIALRRLLRDLKNTKLEGRVIALPSLNWPAVSAGRRNSPIDSGNLNRVFPGTTSGGPTAAIAHFVSSELFPRADLVIDLHSGGSSLDYLPLVLGRQGRNEAEGAEIRRLMATFAAPYSVITDGAAGGAGSTMYAAAESQGVLAIMTELGSGPTLCPERLAIAEAGLRRVLRDYGIAPELEAPDAPTPRMMRTLSPSASIYAPSAGMFEPFFRPGDEIAAGQLGGLLHPLENPLQDPIELRFNHAGTVAYRRFPTLTKTGDALFGLAVPV
ncbi:hypothetical protein GA0061102_104912 [Rhizobium miluonense]|uniref:Succinylglutamate desuccinylase/Aspartoacylase catalytic domain-containing protein n=2 Tax=Rhizobium miluonense TaxID=411945 RepID=A0A1C3WZR9_9HYPH|nr:hypothetical protein GA0061102_104912 [Rhizobium miluonense]